MIRSYDKCRNSCSQMFLKIGVLKNFAIFASKRLEKLVHEAGHVGRTKDTAC